MSDEDESGSGHDVTSYNQKGGVTAGELNLGRQQRSLNRRSKKNLREIGEDEGVQIMYTSGNAEAERYAEEVRDFLESEGCKSVEVHGVLGDLPPGQRIVPSEGTDESIDYQIQIGRSQK